VATAPSAARSSAPATSDRSEPSHGNSSLGGQPPGVARKLRVRPAGDQNAGALPTVSVVIPCYNYARFLPGAVQSALEQDGVRVDVVIVDDASTDRSLQVAHELAADHPAVTVLAHRTNKGPVATFNDGLDLVSGEFLVRLDADDMITPGALLRAVALARAYPSVGLVYGHPVHFSDLPPAPRSRIRSWTVWPGRQWLADRCDSGVNVITAPEVLMRTSVVRRVGGQRPLAHTHDMEMWFRMSAFSDVARVDGPDQAWHRDHADSLSARLVDIVKDLLERKAAFDELFAGPAGAIPEARALQWIAHRALAREALQRACHLFDRGKATEQSVSTLVAFAREVEPVDATLPEWRSLRRRTELGLQGVRRRPWYTAAAVRRRLHGEIRYRRWSRTGAYERNGNSRKALATSGRLLAEAGRP
jgi:Glycosyl transferase family 2